MPAAKPRRPPAEAEPEAASLDTAALADCKYSAEKQGDWSLLADPIWRLCNIYTIRSEEGKPMPFRPNDEQMEVIREIYIYGAKTIVILKARQLGVSTLLCLISLDTILFGTSVEAILIDYNSINAKKKLREKVIFAWDHLDPLLKSQYFIKTKSLQTGEFSLGPLSLAGQAEGPDGKPYSTYIAGETPRGGTFQFTHISEWWEIAARYPQRSADILTAGWPAGEQGVRVVETTVHGGKHGEVWHLAKLGLDYKDEPLPRELRSPKTPVVMFFPWWKKASYREKGSPSLIRQDTHDYFAEKEKALGVTFDNEQRLWYQIQADTLGVFVKGQYPTDLHETWSSPVKGAVWAEALARAKKERRICEVQHDNSLEVDCFFDLGAPDNTACLYVQHVAGFQHLIDYDIGLQYDLPDRLRHMAAKGYRYGTFYLPHDAAARQRNGVSYQKEFEDELKKQGIQGRVVILPRTNNIWLGINKFNLMLSTTVRVDEKKCAKWIESASLYRRKPDTNNPEVFTDEIVHDQHSHGADSSRYLAESALIGHLPHTSNGIMANLYFDSSRLQAATAGIIDHQPTLMALDRQGTTWAHVASRQDPAGWLRVWETPLHGPRYLVAVTNGAVAVWRASGWEASANAERPARMVAACVDEAGINQDKALAWAAMASTYYGLCPVVADITSIPGAVERLREQGVGVAARQQSLAERRVGQATAIRKPGHEFRDEERAQAWAVLQSLWRDGGAELWCPTTLRQMSGVTATESGGFEVLTGYGTQWLDVAALGVWTLGLAAPAMRPGAGSGARWEGDGYTRDAIAENSGLPFEQGRRKLF
jgi:hypothetical protein